MLPQSKIFRVAVTIVAAAVLSLCITFVWERVNVLERFNTAINDIDFTDMYYEHRSDPVVDQNITIVNIGLLSRGELAHLIQIISENDPRVIAADILFSPAVDTLDVVGTNVLATVVGSTKNLVMASAYLGENAEGDQLEHQSPVISKNVRQGVVNLNIATDDREYGTVRSFQPMTNISGSNHLSFGFLVASFLDSTVLEHAGETDMMIRWYGYGVTDHENLRVFKTYDTHEIIDGQFDKNDVKGKIVLLGYMGERLGSFEPGDMFFTPLNKKIIGRSLPDMYGVEVHANAVKMIVDRDFIHWYKTTDFVFNLLVAVVFTLVLFWIRARYAQQYSILSKIALVVFIDVLILGAIGIFFVTNGTMKLLIGDGLLVMLFLPDTYEFLQQNIFERDRWVWGFRTTKTVS